MMGMNNYFYTFSGGALYRHSTNNNRNTYYGAQYPMVMKTVFNNNPLENKLFKTINIEGTQRWQVAVETDIQVGEINEDWFVKKEASFFAFIRYYDLDGEIGSQLPLRSVNGIGRPEEVEQVSGATYKLIFADPVYVGDIIGAGDLLFRFSINQLLPMGVVISVDKEENSITGQFDAAPITAYDYSYVKNNVAESHGVLGHYCIITMTQDGNIPTETFAVETEVMKSYP
jgi:hypothetical protein